MLFNELVEPVELRFESESGDEERWVYDGATNAGRILTRLLKSRKASAQTALPSTTIRLDPEDIAKARVEASARGLHYQTYLKMIIHEALRKAERAEQPAQSVAKS